MSGTIDDHNAEHASDVEWLQTQIRSIRKEKNRSHRRTVVITHHAPVVPESSRPEDFKNPWSSAFGTELLDGGLSEFSEVQWWVSGHTHYTTEFSKGNVKLVSNQRDYVFPNNSGSVLAPPSTLQLIRRRLMCSSNLDNNSFEAKRVLKV